MKPPRTWILTANGTVARVFDYTPLDGLAAVEGHEWSAPPGPEYSDSQGMSHSRFGQSQHRMAAHTGPDHEHLVFAREIATELETAHRKGEFESLVLIAAPAMLGLLRDELDKDVRDTVRIELDKDLTRMPTAELETYLSEMM